MYKLFEGKDPKQVSLQYSYDARIVKIAYELGADFSTPNLKDVALEDIYERRHRKINPISEGNNIYYECVTDRNLTSLRWLLTNVPPSAMVMKYLVVEVTTGYAVDSIRKVIIAAFEGLNSKGKCDKIVLGKTLGYVLIDQCFESEGNMYVHYKVDPSQERKKLRADRELRNIIECFNTYEFNDKSYIRRLVSKASYNGINPEYMHSLVDNVDKSLLNENILELLIGRHEYLEEWFKLDYDHVSDLVVKNYIDRHQEFTIAFRDRTILFHFFSMIPSIVDGM